MLKVEGENRIYIESFVDELTERYQVSDKTALKWLCTSLQYVVVRSIITDEIDFLLKKGVIEAVGSGT